MVLIFFYGDKNMKKTKKEGVGKIELIGGSRYLKISKSTKGKKKGDLVKYTLEFEGVSEDEFNESEANRVMEAVRVSELSVQENIFVRVMSQTHYPLTKDDDKYQLFKEYNDIKSKFYNIKRSILAELDQEQDKIISSIINCTNEEEKQQLESKYESFKEFKNDRALIKTKAKATSLIEKEINNIKKNLWTAAWLDFEDDITLTALDGNTKKTMPKILRTYRAKLNWLESEELEKPNQRRIKKEQLLKDELDDEEKRAYDLVKTLKKPDFIWLRKCLKYNSLEKEKMERELKEMERE